MKLDALQVQQQVATLKLEYPEIWDEDDAFLSDAIEGQTDLKEFMASLEDRRQNTIAMVAGIKTREKELQDRRNRLERRDEAMRRLAFKMMQIAGLRKLELDLATLSIRNGAPRLIVTDDSLLPDALCRIKREPDKQQIKELLTAGNIVRGCELSNAEETLSIRTK